MEEQTTQRIKNTDAPINGQPPICEEQTKHLTNFESIRSSFSGKMETGGRIFVLNGKVYREIPVSYTHLTLPTMAVV